MLLPDQHTEIVAGDFAEALGAADKEVTGTLVKVDVKEKTLRVKMADGEKTYDVNAETKFVGPKGAPPTPGSRTSGWSRG